ncbi:hypothetical protein SK128_003546 [Halocaridina rubra]|uniref:Cerebellar degeneration-related protein 2-like n=1 Tax=Halocaridina rubra TaxID=373956 RepID=A0AAN8XK78_HALRR
MEWRVSALGSGRSWTSPVEFPRARDYKLPHTDSGQNSLEYWDYSVELEMLKGPEDLQLAAELGKTLLERNRELESNIKQQHAVIEDQLQEIEYLSKQTAALREVNDSRLRIYEQLEISIQELEKNNQRLSAEGAADKRKIKSLCGNIESLETRCDELQKNLEEARAGAQQARGRNSKRRSLIQEEQSFRRSHSCENTTQTSDDRAAEEAELKTRLEELQERLKESQKERISEIRRREELEIQLACMSQENAVLQDQLTILREKEVTLRSFDEELASLDDTSSARLCRKCLGHVDETASNPGLYDLQDSIEDTDASIESIHGECALIKLKNGGYAWGSQESLASIGQVVSHGGSGGTSPGTEASDAPHNSLLSELDTSYRILIEKYEALLEAREQQQQQTIQDANLKHESLVHPGVDNLSGPMSLVMTNGMHDNTINMKCQRCHTCTCDLKSSVGRPKSNLEEFSEVETSSSGFSDGESRLSNKSTQTDELFTFEDSTPTPTVANKCLDLSSPMNPCDNRFQAAPEYKKLFQEIFTVLKKTVDENDNQPQGPKTCKTPHSTEASNTDNHDASTITVAFADKNGKAETEKLKDVQCLPSHPQESSPLAPKEPQTNGDSAILESSIATTTNNNNNTDHSFTADVSSEKLPSATEKKISDLRTSENLELTEDRVTHKPPRPDSLDLANSSRSSSRQRRRRRHNRIRLDSLQHQQYQGQYQYTHGMQNPGNSQSQQGSYRPHRKDREQYQQSNQRQQEDFPHLQGDHTENDFSRTRIVYNSARGRCEHHRSRRHRNNSQSQRNQHSQENEIPKLDPKPQINEVESKEKPAPKINYPSVEVAKLRKLEMTYAEALKNSFNRHFNNRRY